MSFKMNGPVRKINGTAKEKISGPTWNQSSVMVRPCSSLLLLLFSICTFQASDPHLHVNPLSMEVATSSGILFPTVVNTADAWWDCHLMQETGAFPISMQLACLPSSLPSTLP